MTAGASKIFIPGRWYIFNNTYPTVFGHALIMKVLVVHKHLGGNWTIVESTNYYKIASPMLSVQNKNIRNWTPIVPVLSDELMLKHIRLTYGVIIE